MQYFQPVDEIVDLPHKSFHEYDLGQAHAKVPEFGGERLELTEVMQLHGGGKVEQHVSEIRTPVGQLMEHRVCDELDGQLDVAQRRAESHTKPLHTHRFKHFGKNKTRTYESALQTDG
jgi:hypothetical protein